MRMLQVHNSKVDKIRQGYTNYVEMRLQAAQEGITFEEFQVRRAQEEDGIIDPTKKTKSARGPTGVKKSLATAKKKFAAKNKDIEVMIKVKDEEGKIVDFPSEGLAAFAPKKKKKVVKTVRTETSSSLAVDAEDTLAMIKQALKTGAAGKLSDEIGQMEDSAVKPKKAKKTTVKKKVEKMPKLES